MAKHAIMSWFGRPMHQEEREPDPPPPSTEPILTMEEELPSGPPLAWSSDRLATTDALWGDGFQFPDGENETLRLAKPLGLSAASSLLLLGVGGGGPACSVATKLGAWVSGFESDPALVAAAIQRIAHRNLTKRAQVETWNPKEPHFREHFYHHGLALEPLHGSDPERTLTAVARALKPDGQLAMIEVVTGKRLDPANPVVSAWARLEHRGPDTVPTEAVITRILKRLRFDVRVTEDISQRHIQQAMVGWRGAVQSMENARPGRKEAMRCIQEAELWLLRLRLFRMGSLRLVRWHAIGGG
jgi:cyclopropane fatty-acyl-phospholipid synthase-like methyltransferase